MWKQPQMKWVGDVLKFSVLWRNNLQFVNMNEPALCGITLETNKMQLINYVFFQYSDWTYDEKKKLIEWFAARNLFFFNKIVINLKLSNKLLTLNKFFLQRFLSELQENYKKCRLISFACFEW